MPYSNYEHTVSLRHGHTDTDRLFIHFLSLNPSSFRGQTIWLAMHMLHRLATLIVAISAFQDINTIKKAVTCTYKGVRDTVTGV